MFADSEKTDALEEKTAMLEDLLGLGEKRDGMAVGALLGKMADSLGALGAVTARLSQISVQSQLAAGIQNGLSGMKAGLDSYPNGALYARITEGILAERPTLGSTALLSAVYRSGERETFAADGMESVFYRGGVAESPYRKARTLRRQSEKLLRV